MSSISCEFDGTFNIVQLKYAGEISCKIDTGAARTVMSLNLLSVLLNYSKRKLLEFLTTVNSDKISFITYSGDKFDAIPCRLSNVRIGDVILKQFLFYVTTANVNTYCLIGMDFVRCCKISGNPLEGILLEKLIEQDYLNSNVVELDDLVVKTDTFLSGANDMVPNS